LGPQISVLKFAVVDIETTGGFPSQHGITEIAIVLHDGEQIEGIYETLINPHQPIPPFIANMTGISNQMVAAAPSFDKVAANIFNLLENRVFVAHNVNFDYGFVRAELGRCGYPLQLPKFCTVVQMRRAYPGLASYSLGKLAQLLIISQQSLPIECDIPKQFPVFPICPYDLLEATVLLTHLGELPVIPHDLGIGQRHAQIIEFGFYGFQFVQHEVEGMIRWFKCAGMA
jgi:hypothetical protein